MSDKEEADKASIQTKSRVKCRAAAPAYRTVLIAACVGVLIGLLLTTKR